MTQEQFDSISKEDLLEGWARSEHLAFMRFCWQKPIEFKVGPHTIAFCEAYDRAVKRFRQGQSSFILGQVSFGHGKSSIISEYAPSHFVGEFPDKDIIVTSYSAEKVSDFSIFGRRLISSDQYRNLYPEIRLDPQEQNVGQWGIHNHFAKITFSGIEGSITGKHASFIIVDDYLKGRADAESAVVRQSTWDAFAHNIMSRRLDPCIFFVLCTPWHTDDIAGRIKQSMLDDPDFPQFEILKFPAWTEDADGKNRKYLFPAMYSDKWYTEQSKTLGSYGTNSLMLCDPKARGSVMIRTDKINFYSDISEVPHSNLRFKRAWDLASSTKSTTKDDPDYTVGIKGSVVKVASAIAGVTIPVVIIDDMVRGQWEATQRQKIIRDTAIADGNIEVGVEAFAAYKDSFTQLTNDLKGIRQVKAMRLTGDKVAKADPLVPVFEAGNIWVKKAPWNDALVKCLSEFPNGKHDDITDTVAVLFEMFSTSSTPGLFTI